MVHTRRHQPRSTLPEHVQRQVAPSACLVPVSFYDQVVCPVSPLHLPRKRLREGTERLTPDRLPPGRGREHAIGRKALRPGFGVSEVDGMVVARVQLLNREQVVGRERHVVLPLLVNVPSHCSEISRASRPPLQYDVAVHRGVLFLAGVLVGVLLAPGCGDGGRRYPVDLPDDAHDLEAMALREDDMPEAGLRRQFADSFDNDEWAAFFEPIVGDIDAEQRRVQLEAQGRIRGYVAAFSWDEPVRHLGKVQTIESTSTLYRDVAAAADSVRRSACGLLISDAEPLEPFDVPHIGDEATGFFRYQEDDTLGVYVETVVCFRTGRVVHAVTQAGLDGTQRTELSIELARKMLAHVNEAFDRALRGQTPTPNGG